MVIKALNLEDLSQEDIEAIEKRINRINDMADAVGKSLYEFGDCTVDEAQGAFLMALMQTISSQEEPTSSAVKAIVSLIMFTQQELDDNNGNVMEQVQYMVQRLTFEIEDINEEEVLH